MTPVDNLAELIRSRNRSARDLTESALGRIDDPQGEGTRAFVAVYHDQALQQSEAVDGCLASGMSCHPLAGLTVSIKDLFDEAGRTTLAGSLALAQSDAATKDAPIVERLKRAGMIIVGRTNMVEFAYAGVGLNPHYGTPKNPWDRQVGRIPGGSSSGAGVAVVDGMCAVSIGTDTGGSVRIPAALCGIVGFKPTARRVPLQGATPLSPSLDSIGPLAPTVRCCALVDSVLSGDPMAMEMRKDPGAVRLALPRQFVVDDLDSVVSRSFERALTRLSRAGVTIVTIDLPELLELRELNAAGGLSPPEAFAWHRDLLASQGERYDPRVRRRIEKGSLLSAADYIALRAARAQWISRMNTRVGSYDALIYPTVAMVAPPIAPLLTDDDLYLRTNAQLLRNTNVINFWDGCSLTIPCHDAGDGPVGFMLSREAGGDSALLSLGQLLEPIIRSTA